MRISSAAKLCMKVRPRFDNYVGVRLQSTCNFIVKLVAAVIQNSGLVFCSIFRKEKHKQTDFIVLVSSRNGASQRRARDERALGERGTSDRGASEGPGQDGAWIFDSSPRRLVNAFPTGT